MRLPCPHIFQVLGHLNQKRAAGASRREEFYLQADAFAVLSEMDFVGIDGELHLPNDKQQQQQQRQQQQAGYCFCGH
jgi:hypothetical protein